VPANATVQPPAYLYPDGHGGYWDDNPEVVNTTDITTHGHRRVLLEYVDGSHSLIAWSGECQCWVSTDNGTSHAEQLRTSHEYPSGGE
jgi:hypothetical protein